MVIENITKFSEASTLAYNIKVKNLQILAALKDKEDGEEILLGCFKGPCLLTCCGWNSPQLFGWRSNEERTYALVGL